MPYRLKTGESVQDGIRRVLSEQIERESKPLGRRLFAEKPKHLARR